MRPETILAFDTSAAHCAAALLLSDGTRFVAHEGMAKGQSERLVSLIEELLERARLGWSDLTAIGVGIGPGNFTGVRISVALARGLALGLGIPAVGVDVFDALAQGQSRPLAVAQDARREEVYVRLYEDAPGSAVLLPIDDAKTYIGNRPVIGSGANHFGFSTGDDDATSLVLAIAVIAQERARLPQPRPSPFYLRDADAAPPSDPPPVILDA